jgi:hypothetical protein
VRLTVFAILIVVTSVAFGACRKSPTAPRPRSWTPTISYDLSKGRDRSVVGWPSANSSSGYYLESSGDVSLVLSPTLTFVFPAASISFTATEAEIEAVTIDGRVSPRAQLGNDLLNWPGLAAFGRRLDGKSATEAIQAWLQGAGATSGENLLAVSRGQPQMRLVVRCMDPVTDQWIAQLDIEW